MSALDDLKQHAIRVVEAQLPMCTCGSERQPHMTKHGALALTTCAKCGGLCSPHRERR